MHVQSYTWRRKFPNDRYYIKAMIGTMWLAQTFYFFSSSTMLYKALISEVKDSDDVPLWYGHSFVITRQP
ncbi:hypothetical protein DL93DRAFT_2090073 [Clavulina sp. PMI_390]|nr:hypothetical protein DL93DRAFT_2090073 [Clavulina sp. PMI_390]